MEKNNETIEKFLQLIVDNKEYSSVKNLRFRLNQLFQDVDFKNKNVLEIGGGNGIYCFYASIMGAKQVLNLEPGGDGSTTNIISNFNKIKTVLGVDNVDIKVSTFQDYIAGDAKFDVVILYNSVNHLNEEACISLKSKPESESIYKGLFSKIYNLSNSGALLFVCDCSNENLYPLIGLKNPIDKNIEWHKHQSPYIWKKLLEKSGFVLKDISWTTFNRLGKFGQLFFGNRFASFFLTSHFCLKMIKK